MLITLGIIGVVAALTLPTIIKSVQNKILAEQFKAAIATVEQGFKRAIAEDTASDLLGTELFKICSEADANATTYNEWRDGCMPVMQKYFKGIKYESVTEQQAQGDTTNIITDTETCKKLVGKTNKWWYLNDHTKCRGWKNIRVTLLNGVVMDFSLIAGGWYAGQITALDVNGAKGPNTWGRDTFYLLILSDGTVTPQFSKRYATFLSKYEGNDYVKYYADPNGAWCEKKCYSTTDAGDQCGACLINNNWKYKY